MWIKSLSAGRCMAEQVEKGWLAVPGRPNEIMKKLNGKRGSALESHLEQFQPAKPQNLLSGESRTSRQDSPRGAR